MSAAGAPAPAAEEPTLLHEFFVRSARQHPQRVAIDVPPGPERAERQTLTYAELLRHGAAVAAGLGPLVSGECVVAILLPRTTPQLYAAQLGVLAAGAAWTCLDPALPDDHLAWVLADSRAVAVLTDATGRQRLSRLGSAAPTLVLPAAAVGTDLPAPPPWLTPATLAYVIYTSGTTGRPKGVLLEHRGIANLVGSDLEYFRLGPADRVAQGSSPAYDSSLEETWLALAAGATVVVMDDDAARLGPDLIDWLRRERITVLCPPPTQLRATGCTDPAAALPDLRLLYVGGEALPQDLADRWSRACWLENGYGPTECTVTVVRGRITPGRPVVIGAPVRGHQAWLLDPVTLAEVPATTAGELCIGGVGLARGYLHQPGLTAERFVQHPRLGRLYRTGDLAQRTANGQLLCLGRIDDQVKVRGYRIELAAVENHLLQCPGVRAAACRVQGEGADQLLVAFVVPTQGAAPPATAELIAALRRTLPEYMVPGRIGMLDALPTTVGGKLDRRRLPELAAPAASATSVAAGTAPRDALEQALATAFAQVLQLPAPPDVALDFFALGGNSLRAAELVSRLRRDPATAALAVRDVYDARTVAALAERVRGAGSAPALAPARPAAAAVPSGARPLVATLVQTAWLLLGLLALSNFLYLVGFVLVPVLARILGLLWFVALSPVLTLIGLLAYTVATALLAATAKRVLIGRYRPLRAPVWGSFYVRNWIVQRMVQLVPWWLLQGTVFQSSVLRLLGARIGRRLHVARGVNLLQGGWDLLHIGDDVSLGHDAMLRVVDLVDGHTVVGPITLHDGAVVEVRAGLDPDTELGRDAVLTASSSLASGQRVPAGERWDGVPAHPAGSAEALPVPGHHGWPPHLHGAAMIAARFALAAAVHLPLFLATLLWAQIRGVSAEQLLTSLWEATDTLAGLGVATALVVASVPLTLLVEALVLGLGRRVPTGAIHRFSSDYLRVWLKNAVVEAAGVWLSGTLFWPLWLRLAGMAVGRNCEISTIVDVVPEHLTLGDECFLADGIYLGSPRVQRSVAWLRPTRLGRRTFLGNHVVVAAGQTLPDDLLLGVSTVADDQRTQPGSAWFGHPPFALPQREVVACDRRLTHDPGPLRYATRVFWEALRFLLPVVPLWLVVAWFDAIDAAATACHWTFLALAVPGVTLAVSTAACLLVLALKWFLLGRVRPGQHPLWSCWCSRWDFLYVAWSLYARPLLTSLEGTLLLHWFLRATGAQIGRRVVLGAGFAQLVDPDMLQLEDDTTVHAMFQAHSFEDRVLKIDRVRIRRGATVGQAAVLLYGADIGEHTVVTPHSVVMKHEHLLPGRSYGGCPTRVLDAAAG